MNFTLRELEAFLGVARLGNFTRAAKALNMSQPALTVRIRHLEDALGVRLLDRTTRSVALTQIGREFLPVVARVLGEIDAVAVNARDVAGRRRGVVTVAALPSAASTLLPAIIAAFKARHRGIVVRLRHGGARHRASDARPRDQSHREHEALAVAGRAAVPRGGAPGGAAADRVSAICGPSAHRLHSLNSGSFAPEANAWIDRSPTTSSRARTASCACVRARSAS